MFGGRYAVDLRLIGVANKFVNSGQYLVDHVLLPCLLTGAVVSLRMVLNKTSAFLNKVQLLEIL
jgi:hypothetical protein